MLSQFRLSSVCRLSVTLVRPTQPVEIFGIFFSPYDSSGTLLFWCQKSLVGDTPFPLKFSIKVTDPFKTAQFRPISAHSASTVIASKKVQLSPIGSRPRAFQRAIDKPCTLPLPQWVAQKRDIAVCASKIQLLSKKVCYKVSLYENFQRQSCSYINPHPTVHRSIAGDVPISVGAFKRKMSSDI